MSSVTGQQEIEEKLAEMGIPRPFVCFFAPDMMGVGATWPHGENKISHAVRVPWGDVERAAQELKEWREMNGPRAAREAIDRGDMGDTISIKDALTARAYQRASWVVEHLGRGRISDILTEAEEVARLVSALRQIEHEESLGAQGQAETKAQAEA